MGGGPTGPPHTDAARPVAALEIVGDESGFAGGNLVGPGHSPVFAHASLTVDPARAAALTTELRLRTRPGPGELKAARLSPERSPDAVAWLLQQPELSPGQALVHLTDTRFFVLARTVDVLLGDRTVVGIDTPGADPALRAAAAALYRASRRSPAPERWDRFLVSAANLLRTHNRWLPPDPLPRFRAAAADLRAAMPDAGAAEVLGRLQRAGARATAVRDALERDRRAAPLMEPLLPALMGAIATWGARTESLTVVHDEQSALTRWRIAGMAARLAGSPGGGRLAEVRRVDSREDPRVQVADLVAGLARHWALATLAGRPDPTGSGSRLRPLVDVRSVWLEPDLSEAQRALAP